MNVHRRSRVGSRAPSISSFSSHAPTDSHVCGCHEAPRRCHRPHENEEGLELPLMWSPSKEVFTSALHEQCETIHFLTRLLVGLTLQWHEVMTELSLDELRPSHGASSTATGADVGASLARLPGQSSPCTSPHSYLSEELHFTLNKCGGRQTPVQRSRLTRSPATLPPADAVHPYFSADARARVPFRGDVNPPSGPHARTKSTDGTASSLWRHLIPPVQWIPCVVDVGLNASGPVIDGGEGAKKKCSVCSGLDDQYKRNVLCTSLCSCQPRHRVAEGQDAGDIKAMLSRIGEETLHHADEAQLRRAVLRGAAHSADLIIQGMRRVRDRLIHNTPEHTTADERESSRVGMRVPHQERTSPKTMLHVNPSSTLSCPSSRTGTPIASSPIASLRRWSQDQEEQQQKNSKSSLFDESFPRPAADGKVTQERGRRQKSYQEYRLRSRKGRVPRTAVGSQSHAWSSPEPSQMGGEVPPVMIPSSMTHVVHPAPAPFDRTHIYTRKPGDKKVLCSYGGSALEEEHPMRRHMGKTERGRPRTSPLRQRSGKSAVQPFVVSSRTTIDTPAADASFQVHHDTGWRTGEILSRSVLRCRDGGNGLAGVSTAPGGRRGDHRREAIALAAKSVASLVAEEYESRERIAMMYDSFVQLLLRELEPPVRGAKSPRRHQRDVSERRMLNREHEHTGFTLIGTSHSFSSASASSTTSISDVDAERHKPHAKEPLDIALLPSSSQTSASAEHPDAACHTFLRPDPQADRVGAPESSINPAAMESTSQNARSAPAGAALRTTLTQAASFTIASGITTSLSNRLPARRLPSRDRPGTDTTVAAGVALPPMLRTQEASEITQEETESSKKTPPTIGRGASAAVRAPPSILLLSPLYESVMSSGAGQRTSTNPQDSPSLASSRGSNLPNGSIGGAHPSDDTPSAIGEDEPADSMSAIDDVLPLPVFPAPVQPRAPPPLAVSAAPALVVATAGQGQNPEFEQYPHLPKRCEVAAVHAAVTAEHLIASPTPERTLTMERKPLVSPTPPLSSPSTKAIITDECASSSVNRVDLVPTEDENSFSSLSSFHDHEVTEELQEGASPPPRNPSTSM